MSSFGKKTVNPGYIPGGHWVICDICGFAVRNFDARKTWDGKVVCPEDWEPRHPQDLLRSRQEDTAPKGLVRSEPADGSTNIVYLQDARAGIARAGLSRAGQQYEHDDPVPTATFGGNGGGL